MELIQSIQLFIIKYKIVQHFRLYNFKNEVHNLLNNIQSIKNKYNLNTIYLEWIDNIELVIKSLHLMICSMSFDGGLSHLKTSCDNNQKNMIEKEINKSLHDTNSVELLRDVLYIFEPESCW